ncbi:MAG: helix-turn-helix transcriptional regulator [Bacteroidota bacterium]
MLAHAMHQHEKKTRNRTPRTKLAAVWERKKKELRMGQDRLAEELGFAHQTSISRYMTGKAPLTLEMAIRFANLLEVSVTEIYEGDFMADMEALPKEDLRNLVLAILDPSEVSDLVIELASSLKQGKGDDDGANQT